MSQLKTNGNPSPHRFPLNTISWTKVLKAMYNGDTTDGHGVRRIFTALSIFVARLGLFGLSVYTAVRRKKEIGVRKVLGASVQSVVTLLSKEFVRLVIIAAIIAFPLAGWAMHKWLQDFSLTRISIEWWVSAAAMIIALLDRIGDHQLSVCQGGSRQLPVTSLRSGMANEFRLAK